MSSFSEIKRRKTEGKKAKFNLPSQLPPTLTIVKLLLCLLRQDIRKKNCAQFAINSVGIAINRGSSAALVHPCKTLQNCGLTGQQPPLKRL